METARQPGSALDATRTAASDGRLKEESRLLAWMAERASHSIETWLWRAATAATREDRLVALSTALELDPKHEGARLAMFKTLRRQLGDDPFLAYVDETDQLYQVQTASHVHVILPKGRACAERYPPAQPGPLRPAGRWLVLALLGLPPSGLGTLIFAPVVLVAALRLPASALSHQDQKRRRVLIAAALVLWLLGLLLGLLVWIHV
jgi:hypothetical protein